MKLMKSMRDVMDAVRSAERRKIAVAAAADADILVSAGMAEAAGIAEFILVGDRARILGAADAARIDVSRMEIVDEADPARSAAEAVGLVREGAADAVMKGFLESSVFLKAVFSPEAGLRQEDRLISAMAVMEMSEYDRLIFISDPGFIPAPDLETKKKIILNALPVMGRMGIAEPKVALLCAAETVSPKMASTVEAKALEDMNRRGELPGCVVAGPISLDLAVSEISARHKGYESPVAGKADLLVVPTLEVGNILYKSMVYFAHVKTGGVVAGAKAPVVFTSRADSPETKLHTIALAVFLAREK
jgi:phosphate butyryltransferase